MIFVILVVTFISLLSGYLVGIFKKNETVIFDSKDLPDYYFRVISIDKVSSVIEEISIDKRRFLVSTRIFNGKPIKPMDTVRKTLTKTERKIMGIKESGYHPLIKVC